MKKALILVLLVLVGCGERHTYTLVMNCKPPAFRRVKESIIQRNDGYYFYKDRNGVLSMINPDAKDLNETFKRICKRV